MICEVCNKTKATCARRSPFSENLFFSCQECADKGWFPYGMTVRYCVEQLSKPEHLQKPMLVKRLLLENQIKADIIEAQKMIQGLLTGMTLKNSILCYILTLYISNDMQRTPNKK